MRSRNSQFQTPNPLPRAIRYLGNYRRQALLPYVFLIVATLAQLAVPRMVGNIIDAISQGAIARSVLDGLSQIPAAFLPLALPQLLTFLGLPDSWSAEQLIAYMQSQMDAAPRALVMAGIAIVVFALLRGLFAFLQSYWAERNSQDVAFDLRNDLFAKIQRLSFSYHDRNQTGQLMVRATDDVEKVRLFIGQGLLQLFGALLLITGTLIILFTTNARLTLVVLPILPLALITFMLFGMHQPAAVHPRPAEALRPEHHPAGEPGRHQSGQSLHPRAPAAGQVRPLGGRSDEAGAGRRAPVLIPLPGGLPDRQPGPGGGAVLRRASNHRSAA